MPFNYLSHSCATAVHTSNSKLMKKKSKKLKEGGEVEEDTLLNVRKKNQYFLFRIKLKIEAINF